MPRQVAFYKMCGLSKLFPNSKKFGRYHLNYLPTDEVNEVDVLSGAFMFMRKSVLDKIGLLDEQFFMYGEDIDLSYRIQKAGYKNYYFPEAQIIHYKGESTKKNSLNYVVIFYKAMAIFSKKHFSGSNAFWFNFLIHLAIVLKASVALVKRFFTSFTIVILDFLILTLGLFFIKELYQQNIGLQSDIYSEKILNIAFPIYSLVWITLTFFNGGYDKPIKLLKILRGVVLGTVVILMGYSLLPESLRFSRALILFGTLWAICSYLITRLIYHLLKIKSYTLSSKNTKRIAIIGAEIEFNRVAQLLKETNTNASFLGFVSAENNGVHNPLYLGKLNQIDEIIKIHAINEIIFCAKDISSQFIINNMLMLVSSGIDFKIAPPESLSIIGSNNIDTAGELYMIDVNSISKPNNKRNKRLIDISISLLVILGSPLLYFMQDKKANYFSNAFSVLVGFYSWVGYGKAVDKSLPEIKPSVLFPSMLIGNNIEHTKNKLININYAKDYKVEKDLMIIWKCRTKLSY